jgi:hypothetical protein
VRYKQVKTTNQVKKPEICLWDSFYLNRGIGGSFVIFLLDGGPVSSLRGAEEKTKDPAFGFQMYQPINQRSTNKF